jgi:hypothetical protein
MNTIITYKLFRIKDNKLYPLYVDANESVPIGIWLDAKEGERTTNGKVKSRLGSLAFRPGWHSSLYPVALHIGEKANPGDSLPSYRPNNQIWAEVEIHANVDWQSIADAQGKAARDKCLKFIPKDGFYKYKTSPNMFGKWFISGELKINRILSDDEVKSINSKIEIYDLPRR